MPRWLRDAIPVGLLVLVVVGMAEKRIQHPLSTDNVQERTSWIWPWWCRRLAALLFAAIACGRVVSTEALWLKNYAVVGSCRGSGAAA